MLIVSGVLVGVLLALAGLRWVALYYRAERNRAAEQEQIRDALDDALAELALVVVEGTPDDPRASRDRANGGVAAGYVGLLARARVATGGWASLLREARELLGDSDRDAESTARTARS